MVVWSQAGDGSGACGWASSGHGILVMAEANCGISPATPASFPAGATYLLAHELTHLLGAVPGCAPHETNGGHVGDSNADILYSGPGTRDWGNLTLDVGRDDYYDHSIDGCPDIIDSPLWLRPS